MNKKFTFVLICIAACFIQQSKAQYLQFVENKGQWNTEVKYASNFGSGNVLLQSSGYKIILHSKDDLKRIAGIYSGHKDSSVKGDLKSDNSRNLIIHSHAYQVSFLNANANALVEPDKPLNTFNNYFLGSDSTKWKTGCRIYNGVIYKNVYKNIDVRYYSDNGNLKYDFIIHPGADANTIAVQFNGLDGLSVNKYGNLVMKTSVGDVYQSIPSSYQIVNGLKNNVKANFILQGNIVHFKINNYDKTQTLIIDPTEIFSTFTGSISDNWGYTATYDNAGNFFAGGIAFANGFVNRGVGGYDASFNGGNGTEGDGTGTDIALIKFNATGNLALYSTYLGGGGDEVPTSLVADSYGNLIITGRTSSKDYPTTLPTFGNGGGYDIILTKLSADGKSLLSSRKFGGEGDDGVNILPKDKLNGTTSLIISLERNYGDDARGEVIVDNNNNVFVASCTRSALFPTTSNATNTKVSGNQDGVFIKTSPDFSTVYASNLISGNGDDAAFVLDISKTTGNVYVGGGTASSNLAYNATNAADGIIHNSFQGGQCDGFIAEFTNNGVLLKTCYVGTNGNDMVYGLKMDKFGFPYITGTTTTAFPVLNSPFNANGNQQKGNQFITKINADLTQIIYNTNFGKGLGTPDISPIAFLVDVCTNVYVSGWGGGLNKAFYNNQQTTGLSTTANAILRSTDGNDFYFFVLEKNASSQLFGSFFGEQDSRALGDHVDGGTSRFDQRGIIYQAICANCGKAGIFPTTSNSWSPGNPASLTEGAAACNEAAVKIAFEFSGVIASLRPSINGVINDSVGCVPLTVDFADTIALGKKYVWSFGDGSSDITTTTPNTSHTYQNVGNYRVRVISIDSSTCNISDTAYLTIKAKNNKANLDYTIVKLQPCQSLSYQFNNNSTAPAGSPFKPNDFTWDFGDGTKLMSNAAIVTHNYAAPGTYFVKLSLNDTAYCNSPDSIVTQLRVASVLLAQFQTPSTGCAPYNAIFSNISIGGQNFVWDFGDGTTSTEISPTHLYVNPGTYIIHLTATDNLTCNPTDDTSLTINVVQGPAASFTYSPAEPKENTPYVFSNTSTSAVKYKWEFGDGDTLLTSTMLPVTHLYNTTNTFNVCLIAFNANGCTDTSCEQVKTIVVPLVDIPNAFSPNGDGINDVVAVKGYGIAKMNWRIYNRWGQLMFTSNSLNNAWDGKYKGAVQPQDVYAYVLNVIFTDNSVYNKKGDITLLR